MVQDEKYLPSRLQAVQLVRAKSGAIWYGFLYNFVYKYQCRTFIHVLTILMPQIFMQQFVRALIWLYYFHFPSRFLKCGPENSDVVENYSIKETPFQTPFGIVAPPSQHILTSVHTGSHCCPPLQPAKFGLFCEGNIYSGTSTSTRKIPVREPRFSKRPWNCTSKEFSLGCKDW